MKSALQSAARAVLVASILAGAATAQALPQAPQAVAAHAISPGRMDRVGQVLQTYVDQGRIAGAVVQIQQDGREVYSVTVGWRDKEGKSPMAKDTIFRIASQSKALTSVAIMMLSEDGKLLLSDPIGKYLPEWSKTTVAVANPDGGYSVVPAKRPITIRDLLTHTSGISYGYGLGEQAWKDAGITGWYFADRNEPVSAVVARMAALPMAAQPGEAFVYGYSTDILGVIVEKVSGKTLDAFLTERLIQPLGMKDTSFYLPRDKAGRLAAVYAAGEGGLRRADSSGQGHYLDGPRIAFSGGAGLLSTAPDYSRFLEMLRRGGELDGRRYLSRKSVELMTSNHLNIPYDPGKGFGLGFSIRTDVGKAGEPGSQGEFGWGGAYHSSYWVDPAEGLTVVYMTQLMPAGDIDDHGKLRTLIYQALE
ncbi:serine hydrolase domain-containing protein [Asticcacaulis sp. AC460]|uniref:serine hydrolase domain-containing protein n=1 Tax=Asticcacaulis sp. AC460 TaxID=1282360 RepID=UPI0004CE2C91|nr:serine hydrolase domain-containing protein [Asticcacaulis sp. AC460]